MEKEAKDWELNPDRYLQDDEGNFVRKKDGTPRLKAGRPLGSGSSYNVSSSQKAKYAVHRKIARKKKNIKKLEEKLNNARKSYKATTNTINKLSDKTDRVVSPSELDELPKAVQDILPEQNVLFHPNEGPQTDFLAAGEKDVLYGGAAGGGKSYAMLIDPLRYAHKKAHRALILRRSMPELREMIDKSRELYPLAFQGAKFREVEKLWNFPSGAKVEFGFLERDADVYRYQGQAYSWIGFDEITHLPTEFSWNYLASRLRTTDPEIQTYLRCTDYT